MSSSFTYNELKQALQDWPQTENAEYVANLDRFIKLAEDRLITDLNLEIFDQFDTPLLTGGSAVVTKPTDMLAERGLFYISGGGEVPSGDYRRLIKRSYEFVQNFWPDGATTGTPKYYCELDETSWMAVPPPSAAWSVEIRYVKRPASLTAGAGTGTTWMSSRCGDLLFAASLMEAEHYLKADDRYGDMKAKYYEELLPMRRMELRVAIRNGDFSPMKPGAGVQKK